MSPIIEQAEELRKQAISLLLQERESINEKLDQLGYENGQAVEVKKARMCKKCGASGHNAKTCPVSSPETI